MAQSRRASAAEAASNIGIGLLVSVLMTMFVVAPLAARFGVEWLGSLEGGLTITGIYTIASFVRAYALRRFYDKLSARGKQP